MKNTNCNPIIPVSDSEFPEDLFPQKKQQLKVKQHFAKPHWIQTLKKKKNPWSFHTRNIYLRYNHDLLDNLGSIQICPVQTRRLKNPASLINVPFSNETMKKNFFKHWTAHIFLDITDLTASFEKIF